MPNETEIINAYSITIEILKDMLKDYQKDNRKKDIVIWILITLILMKTILTATYFFGGF